MYVVNMASDCTDKETSFGYLHDLGNISILWDKDNGLEEKITHLFQVSHFNFEKNTTSQALNILKACTVIRGNTG